MILNKIIPVKDFIETKYLQCRYTELYLPTEIVISTPCSVSPQIARMYDTELYYYNKEIVDYSVLNKIPGFNGVYNYSEIVLLEIFENGGDDGHIEYEHQGFSFVVKETIKKLDSSRKYPIGFVRDLY